MNHRLLYLVTADWYFCSHRLGLAAAAREAGYQVTVVTQEGADGDRIRSHGLDLVPVAFPRSPKRPLADLKLVARLPGIYRRVAPQLVHHVGIKPVIYGSLAAARARTPVTVNALVGLGYSFATDHGAARLWRRALSAPMRRALGRDSAWTLLQNQDDADLLAAAGLARPDRIRLVRGSGVDVHRFRPQEEPPGLPVVLLAARMLWDKGVGEYVAAARVLRDRGVQARFVLAGHAGDENPAAIDRARLARWTEEGIVEWLGHRTDMPGLLAGAHIACLPSYREGLPKSLLEAAAAGRPMVATDVPGCREVVRHGLTGLLVPPRDHAALADALQALIEDPSRRRTLGAAARCMAESEFSVERISAQTIALYDELIARACRR